MKFNKRNTCYIEAMKRNGYTKIIKRMLRNLKDIKRCFKKIEEIEELNN